MKLLQAFLLYTFVLAVAGAMKPKTAATKAECDTFIASLDADAIVSAKYVRIKQFNVTMHTITSNSPHSATPPAQRPSGLRTGRGVLHGGIHGAHIGAAGEILHN